MGSVHDASRAAAARRPSERTDADKAAINMGDQATRNADYQARRMERIHGKAKQSSSGARKVSANDFFFVNPERIDKKEIKTAEQFGAHLAGIKLAQSGVKPKEAAV